MAVISWWVMIGKGLFVNATAKANERFLQAFRKYAGEYPLHDPAWIKGAQDDGPLNGDRSNLARLLAIGLDELRNRVAAAGGRSVVRTQSIAAIRSALDAAAVREGQRLNKMMVLLTIAISGGPFIGLLGTVLGVMITFASVAAAGEVNVNAIAPGISAALAATVTGLRVLDELGADVFHRPEQSLYLWARFPGIGDANDLTRRCLERGVMLAPGSIFSVDRRDRVPWTRLNVAYLDDPAFRASLRT